MNRLSDRGSIPLRSIPEKPLKSSVLAVFLYIFDGKNRAKMPLETVSDRLKPHEFWSKKKGKIRNFVKLYLYSHC